MACRALCSHIPRHMKPSMSQRERRALSQSSLCSASQVMAGALTRLPKWGPRVVLVSSPHSWRVIFNTGSWVFNKFALSSLTPLMLPYLTSSVYFLDNYKPTLLPSVLSDSFFPILKHVNSAVLGMFLEKSLSGSPVQWGPPSSGWRTRPL